MASACELCNENPIDRKVLRTGELSLCAPCHRGEFGARLEARGIAWRERRWIEDQGENAHFIYHVELAAGVPFALDLRMELCAEGALHRIGKLFVRELQTGDPIFDDAVYVRTASQERAALVLASSGARDAIVDALSNTHTLRIDGNVAWILEFGSLANAVPDTRALARALAALAHHLGAVAAESAIAPAPVDFTPLRGSAYPERPGHRWDR